MKSNNELKSLAYERVHNEGWFWRILGVSLVLNLVGHLAMMALKAVLVSLGVSDWQDYALAVLINASDLVTPVPILTSDYLFQISTSTGLEMFVLTILTGIASFGVAVALLSSVENKVTRNAIWGGFARPFGMFALTLRLFLIYFFWSLLALFTGLLAVPFLIRAFYTYRFAWLVKAENPDLSAGECLKRCKELMHGNKMRSFKLDAIFWKPILLVMALACSPFVSIFLGLGRDVSTLLTVLSMGVVWYVTIYLKVAQTMLYREICPQKVQ